MPVTMKPSSVLVALAALYCACFQPSCAREDVNFDFAWRFRIGDAEGAGHCPANVFSNKSGVQCSGLNSNGEHDSFMGLIAPGRSCMMTPS